jgi:hypothetical protein
MSISSARPAMLLTTPWASNPDLVTSSAKYTVDHVCGLMHCVCTAAKQHCRSQSIGCTAEKARSAGVSYGCDTAAALEACRVLCLGLRACPARCSTQVKLAHSLCTFYLHPIKSVLPPAVSATSKAACGTRLALHSQDGTSHRAHLYRDVSVEASVCQHLSALFVCMV